MNHHPNEKELHEVIERRSTGKTSFGEFLEELSNIGITQYDIDVATGKAIYKGKHSKLNTESQVDFVMSDSFNRNLAIQAIANLTLPFLDFLRELANAGVTSYNVNIGEKKATYFGVTGEQITEPLQL
jgi:uncharacterized protein YbcV (DUF1398 family)